MKNSNYIKFLLINSLMMHLDESRMSKTYRLIQFSLELHCIQQESAEHPHSHTKCECYKVRSMKQQLDEICFSVASRAWWDHCPPEAPSSRLVTSGVHAKCFGMNCATHSPQSLGAGRPRVENQGFAPL